MEWWLTFLVIFGALIVVFSIGMPVAFSFLVVNSVFLYIMVGGDGWFHLMLDNGIQILTSFSLIPLPMFLLMGVVLAQTGYGKIIIDSFDAWVGSIPGRLGLLSVATGTLLATLSGVGVASTAILTKAVAPIMREKGYSKRMIVGPILGANILGPLIPPSGYVVITSAIAEVSTARSLLAIAVPGFLIALMMGVYIFIAAKLNPTEAPAYKVHSSLRLKMKGLLDVMPAAIVVFLVTGVIFIGVATPTEAAATGAFGAFIVCALYRRLSWDALKRTVIITAEITVMMFVIFFGAIVFGTLLSVTGASRGLVEFTTGLGFSAPLITAGMIVIVLILGCLVETLAITMITLPIFIPVVRALNVDPIWFCTMYTIAKIIGAITPPYGTTLFLTRGLLPDMDTMTIWKSSVPYIIMGIILIAIVFAFPDVAMWLPKHMR